MQRAFEYQKWATLASLACASSCTCLKQLLLHNLKCYLDVGCCCYVTIFFGNMSSWSIELTPQQPKKNVQEADHFVNRTFLGVFWSEYFYWLLLALCPTNLRTHHKWIYSKLLSVVMPHVLSDTYPGSVSIRFALQRLVRFDLSSPDRLPDCLAGTWHSCALILR